MLSHMPARRNRSNAGNQPDLRDLEAAANAFMRLDRRAQLAIAAVLLVAGVIAAVVYVRSQRQPPQAGPIPQNPPAGGPAGPSSASGGVANLLLGNPSDATADPANKANYLMVKPYFALCYNNAVGTANWVSWRVTRGDLGQAERKPFNADPTLPPGFYRVTSADYNGSGFDRGHICPHSDRAANDDMSGATFAMTNIMPQAPNVNQRAWKNLEEYGRKLVADGHRLYVVAGPWGRGGVCGPQGRKGPDDNGFRTDVGKGRVAVPAECWKVIVVVPESGGNDDLAKVNDATRVIAVDMPNDDDRFAGEKGEEWAGYRTSPAAVEQKTRLRFFTALRPDVAEALRRKVDDVPIPKPKSSSRGGSRGRPPDDSSD